MYLYNIGGYFAKIWSYWMWKNWSMHANILHQEDDVILESVFDINKNFAKAVSNKTGLRFAIKILNYLKTKTSMLF